MTDVEVAAGIGQHGQRVIFLFAMINHRTIQLIRFPFILPLLFNRPRIIGFILARLFFLGRNLFYRGRHNRFWLFLRRNSHNRFDKFGRDHHRRHFFRNYLNRLRLRRDFLRLDRSFHSDGFLSLRRCGNSLHRFFRRSLFRNYFLRNHLLSDDFLCSALRWRGLNSLLHRNLLPFRGRCGHSLDCLHNFFYDFLCNDSWFLWSHFFLDFNFLCCSHSYLIIVYVIANERPQASEAIF